MPVETICSVDISALSVRDLKALCRRAVEDWGQVISLSSSKIRLIEYLEAYRQWKIDQVRLATIDDSQEQCDEPEEYESCDVLEGWAYESCDVLEGWVGKASSIFDNVRLGQLLQEEHDRECRDWWSKWEVKYDAALGKALKAIAPKMTRKVEVLTPVEAAEPAEPTTVASPVFVALCFLVAFAIMLDIFVQAARYVAAIEVVKKLSKDISDRVWWFQLWH